MVEQRWLNNTLDLMKELAILPAEQGEDIRLHGDSLHPGHPLGRAVSLGVVTELYNAYETAWEGFGAYNDLFAPRGQSRYDAEAGTDRQVAIRRLRLYAARLLREICQGYEV